MRRSDVYKTIRDRLLSELGDGLTVDVNMGQMDSITADYPLPTPLALISIAEIQWTDVAEGIQIGTVSFTIDYYKVIASGTFSGAEAEDTTLALLDSPDEIYQALRDYEVAGMLEGVLRTGEREVRIDKRLAGFRISYTATVFEE